MIIDIHEQKQGSDFGDLFNQFQEVSQGVESRARETAWARLEQERKAREADLERQADEIIAKIPQTQVQARESGPVSSRAGQVVDRYFIEEEERTVGSCCSAPGDSLSPACFPQPRIIKRQVSRAEYDAHQEKLKKDAARAAAACNCV